MAFPAGVKRDALRLSARHCCVCRLPKARDLEVHHIVPEADGGASTLENAVVLCYDCHAHAGHYNSRQPRGNRFHPDEIRELRDKWHEAVAVNSLGTLEDPSLACQYLIVSDKKMCADLLSAKAESLPIASDTFFYPLQTVRSFQQAEVLRAVGGFNLGAEEEQVTRHALLGDYLAAHSDSQASVSGGVRRAFTVDHLLRIGAPQLPFIREMGTLGVSLERLAWISAHQGGCGDGSVTESWWLPEFVAIWILVTNVDSQAVTPRRVRGIVEESGDCFAPRSFAPRVAEANSSFQLPPAPLLPRQSLAFPIASAYREPASASLVGDSLLMDSVAPGAYQQFSVIGHWPALKGSWLVGPAWWPLEIEYARGAATGIAPIHTLEPTNTYSMAGRFEVGSCPHAFYRVSSDSEWRYLRPVLVGALECESSDRVHLPLDAVEACIVELELERTSISQLRVGSTTFRNIVLNPEGGLIVDVRDSPLIELSGRYELLGRWTLQSTRNQLGIGPRYFSANADRYKLTSRGGVSR